MPQTYLIKDQFIELGLSSISSSEIKASDYQDCPICLNQFQSATCCTASESKGEDKGVSIKACGHTFHYSCLKTWLEKQRTCPMCRHELFQYDYLPEIVRAYKIPMPDGRFNIISRGVFARQSAAILQRSGKNAQKEYIRRAQRIFVRNYRDSATGAITTFSEVTPDTIDAPRWRRALH